MYQHAWDRFLKIKINPRLLLKMLLSDVDVELRLNDISIGSIGAGSISLLSKLRGISEESFVEIGRFCQINRTAKILVGAEHSITQHINNSWSGVPLLHSSISSSNRPQMLSKGKCVLGSGVIVGANSVLLSGAVIGDGVIVGASTLCVKEYPSYVVLGGVPAKILKERPDSARPVNYPYWDLKCSVLHSIAERNLDFKDIEKRHLRRSSSKVVMKVITKDGRFHGCEVLGLLYENEFTDISKLSKNFRAIFMQLNTDSEYIIVTNDFDELLYSEEILLST